MKLFSNLKDKIKLIKDNIVKIQMVLNVIAKIQLLMTKFSEFKAKFKASKLFENFKRISFDLIGAASVLAVFLYVPFTYFPPEAKAALIGLIITKFILITLGNVHFFITRHLMYKYIKFSCEKEWSNNAMIIVMYIIIVWSWARGG